MEKNTSSWEKAGFSVVAVSGIVGLYKEGRRKHGKKCPKMHPNISPYQAEQIHCSLSTCVNITTETKKLRLFSDSVLR